MKKGDLQIGLFDISIPQELDGKVDAWYADRGFKLVAGVDEVGRGALAGPVCAAAVILGEKKIKGLNDSKLILPQKRETLCEEIWKNAAAVGIAYLGPGQIDEFNILRASLKAMALAVGMLKIIPDLVLVDGDYAPPTTLPTVALIKGDRRSEAIMAASIVAKVSRDRYMKRAAVDYPGYGFEVHKGYSVEMHQKALTELGPCPIHRMSFEPCRAASR
jgi:ribonuclease HII